MTQKSYMLLRVDITPGMNDSELMVTFPGWSGDVRVTADARLFARDSQRECRLVVRGSQDDEHWLVEFPTTPFGTLLVAFVDGDLIVEKLDNKQAASLEAIFEEELEAGRRLLEASGHIGPALAWRTYEQSGADSDLTEALIASGLDRNEANLRTRMITSMNERMSSQAPQHGA